MDRLSRPELLYLAAFWHDMAKGRGGDHSEIGADDAERFCLDHGLSHGDAALVRWLVKSNLLLSLTDQKPDLSYYTVIAEVTTLVGNRQPLDYPLLHTSTSILPH